MSHTHVLSLFDFYTTRQESSASNLEPKKSNKFFACTLATDTPSLHNPGRSSDPSLTDLGFKQAAALGQLLGEQFSEACGRVKPEHAIKRLVVSPMRRWGGVGTPGSITRLVTRTIPAVVNRCF